MRTFKFQFVVECAGAGQADQELIAKMIDLSMQDLVMDDEFIDALDEKEAVTIQVIPILDK
jgi:hypothetical protein